MAKNEIQGLIDEVKNVGNKVSEFKTQTNRAGYIQEKSLDALGNSLGHLEGFMSEIPILAFGVQAAAKGLSALRNKTKDKADSKNQDETAKASKAVVQPTVKSLSTLEKIEVHLYKISKVMDRKQTQSRRKDEINRRIDLKYKKRQKGSPVNVTNKILPGMEGLQDAIKESAGLTTAGFASSKAAEHFILGMSKSQRALSGMMHKWGPDIEQMRKNSGMSMVHLEYIKGITKWHGKSVIAEKAENDDTQITIREFMREFKDAATKEQWGKLKGEDPMNMFEWKSNEEDPVKRAEEERKMAKANTLKMGDELKAMGGEGAKAAEMIETTMNSVRKNLEHVQANWGSSKHPSRIEAGLNDAFGPGSGFTKNLISSMFGLGQKNFAKMMNDEMQEYGLFSGMQKHARKFMASLTEEASAVDDIEPHIANLIDGQQKESSERSAEEKKFFTWIMSGKGGGQGGMGGGNSPERAEVMKPGDGKLLGTALVKHGDTGTFAGDKEGTWKSKGTKLTPGEIREMISKNPDKLRKIIGGEAMDALLAGDANIMPSGAIRSKSILTPAALKRTGGQGGMGAGGGCCKEMLGHLNVIRRTLVRWRKSKRKEFVMEKRDREKVRRAKAREDASDGGGGGMGKGFFGGAAFTGMFKGIGKLGGGFWAKMAALVGGMMVLPATIMKGLALAGPLLAHPLTWVVIGIAAAAWYFWDDITDVFGKMSAWWKNLNISDEMSQLWESFKLKLTDKWDELWNDAPEATTVKGIVVPPKLGDFTDFQVNDGTNTTPTAVVVAPAPIPSVIKDSEEKGVVDSILGGIADFFLGKKAHGNFKPGEDNWYGARTRKNAGTPAELLEQAIVSFSESGKGDVPAFGKYGIMPNQKAWEKYSDSWGKGYLTDMGNTRDKLKNSGKRVINLDDMMKNGQFKKKWLDYLIMKGVFPRGTRPGVPLKHDIDFEDSKNIISKNLESNTTQMANLLGSLQDMVASGNGMGTDLNVQNNNQRTVNNYGGGGGSNEEAVARMVAQMANRNSAFS